MKRDMDLIRLSLLKVEGDEDVDHELQQYSEDAQNYHMALLVDAEYVVGAVSRPGQNRKIPRRVVYEYLTWEGHEFLDGARDKSTWRAAIQKVADMGTTASIGVIKALLVDLAKKRLGIE